MGEFPVPMTEMDHRDPALLAELLQAVERVARRGAFTGGEFVERFERSFAAWCGAPEAVGVSSGTEALTLTLRALGVQHGVEVIVPANSFIATAEAVCLAGGVPRFADVDPDTQLMTAETLERAFGDRVSGVIPVHLFGRTVDMGPCARWPASGEYGCSKIAPRRRAPGLRGARWAPGGTRARSRSIRPRTSGRGATRAR